MTSFFSSQDFDLIIEDGSHLPEHQILALLKGLPAVKSGGLFILEDICTSHPAYIRKTSRWFGKLVTPKGNALTVLLGIEHYLRLGIPVDEKKADLLAKNSLMSAKDVMSVASAVSRIHFYRRTRLPERCIRCGSVDYNFSTYRCLCGKRIFADYDSMTFVLEKK